MARLSLYEVYTDYMWTWWCGHLAAYERKFQAADTSLRCGTFSIRGRAASRRCASAAKYLGIPYLGTSVWPHLSQAQSDVDPSP